jgi:hypothetical protein
VGKYNLFQYYLAFLVLIPRRSTLPERSFGSIPALYDLAKIRLFDWEAP